MVCLIVCVVTKPVNIPEVHLLFRKYPRPSSAVPIPQVTLFRRNVCCGSEGYCRLGMDQSLFLACCSCHSGTRSCTHGRSDQGSLATTSQSTDERSDCSAATYFGYIAFGVALALSA